MVDLSNFYLDIAKDRLYIPRANSPRRRSCQTVLQIALENLAKAIAPVLCHLAEDIWQYLPYPNPHKSVFEAGWIDLPPQWQQPQLVAKWTKIRQIRAEVNKVLEQARNDKMIGASLEAKVLLYLQDQQIKEDLTLFRLSGNQVDELRYFFLASQVELVEDLESIQQADYQSQSDLVAVGVIKAEGKKCDRCWHYSTLVGEFSDHPLLCERCHEALVAT